jgi:DNA-binding response OmpR family regulator
MEDGADYFLPRPVSAPILKAMLVSMFRRMHIVNQASDVGASDWVFNRRKRILVSPSGQQASFSERETAILAMLFMSAHAAVSTERLLQSLNMTSALFDPHRIDTIIYRIRMKLKKIGNAQLEIKNLYGQGYICIDREVNARFYVLDGQ